MFSSGDVAAADAQKKEVSGMDCGEAAATELYVWDIEGLVRLKKKRFRTSLEKSFLKDKIQGSETI